MAVSVKPLDQLGKIVTSEYRLWEFLIEGIKNSRFSIPQPIG